MKRTLILLSVVLFFELRAVAGFDTDVAQTNRTILSSGRWKPSVDDTQKALATIQVFLENTNLSNNRTKNEIKKIQEHAKEYRVQFVGIVRDGKRLVLCNFFRADDVDEPDWRHNEVRVMDGGFWYWRIEYDPSVEKCLNFSSNDYA